MFFTTLLYSFGCIATIRCGNACHGPYSDSLYSGSEHSLFNSLRLVKHEAGFPNPRRALIGSNQLWRVNDSPYYREWVIMGWREVSQNAGILVVLVIIIIIIIIITVVIIIIIIIISSIVVVVINPVATYSASCLFCSIGPLSDLRYKYSIQAGKQSICSVQGGTLGWLSRLFLCCKIFISCSMINFKGWSPGCIYVINLKPRHLFQFPYCFSCILILSQCWTVCDIYCM